MTQFLGRCSISQAPKKEKKDEDEDDAAFKAKKKAEADALQAAKNKGTDTTLIVLLKGIADISNEQHWKVRNRWPSGGKADEDVVGQVAHLEVGSRSKDGIVWRWNKVTDGGFLLGQERSRMEMRQER
jgi:hypothetical protein